jgi:hypothetical protein
LSVKNRNEGWRTLMHIGGEIASPFSPRNSDVWPREKGEFCADSEACLLSVHPDDDSKFPSGAGT